MLRNITTTLAFTLIGILSAGIANAALTKVDLNGQGPAVATWNEIASPGGPTSVLDINGDDEGITVDTTPLSDSSGTGNEGAFDSGFWDDVADDYFFVNGGSANITIAGLDNNLTYNLQVIGSDNDDNRISDFQANGNFGDGVSPFNGDNYHVETDGFLAARVATFSSVSPISNQIILSVTDVSDVGIISAFTIEANPALMAPTASTPEPSSFALAALGLLMVIRRRRS